MENPNDSMAVVFCNKGHIHQGQKLEFICLNTLCRKERLCCNICKTTKHKNHETIELEVFIKEVERKASTQLKMNSFSLLDEIDKKSIQCQTVMKAIQGYVKAKIEKIDAKVEMYYLNAKRDIARSNDMLFPDQLRQLRKGSEIGCMEEQVQILLDQIVLKEGKVTKFFSSTEETSRMEELQQALGLFQKQLVEGIKTIHNVVSEQYVRIQQACSIQEKECSIEQSQQGSSSKRFQEGEYDGRKQQYGNSNIGNQIAQGSQDRNGLDQQSQQQQQRQIQNSQGGGRLGKTLMRQGSDYVISGGSNSSNHKNLQARSNSSATRGRQAEDTRDTYQEKQQPQQQQQQQQQQQPVLASVVVPSEMQQLQQSQLNLLKQIKDQQIQLEQLQKQQEYKMQSVNASKQYQSPQQSQSFERSSGYHREESKLNEGILNLSKTSSHVSANSISPSRLLFYSTLFKQHTLSKQASYASPFSAYIRASSSNTSQNNLSSQKAYSPAGYNNNSASTTGNPQISHSKSSSFIQPANNFQAGNAVDKRTRWWDDDNETTSRMEQDIQESDFVNKRMEQMPRSLDRKIKFHFDKKLKHSSIDCIGEQPVMTVRGSSECISAKLALLVPSLETQPPQEFKWAVKVVNCQSIAYSNPLAVGVCLRKTVEEGSFDFKGEDNVVLDKKGVGARGQTHGCYLLTAQGIVRNCSDAKQDMKQVGVRFDKGDTLVCEYNPFRKYLKIKNKQTGKFCMINISFNSGDKLYPCVRISYCQDILEFSQDEDE